MEHHPQSWQHGDTELGTRGFLPVDESQLLLDAFIGEMMSSTGLDGPLPQVASTAAWQALSLFKNLGVDHTRRYGSVPA